jgi:hypothetical protein
MSAYSVYLTLPPAFLIPATIVRDRVALSRAEQILDAPVDESDSYRNKFQRALSTLALADVCLVQAQQYPKQKRKPAIRE